MDNATSPGAINAAPTNGSGESLDFEAANGKLDVTASLSANAVGSGSGGSVTLKSNSNTLMSVNGGATTNGINGTITANAVGSGSGGSVTVQNGGSGGTSLSSTTDISANAVGTGAGGSITLGGGSGTLTIPVTAINNTFNVSAVGTSTNAGGTITLSGSNVVANGPSGVGLNLYANGVGLAKVEPYRSPTPLPIT